MRFRIGIRSSQLHPTRAHRLLADQEAVRPLTWPILIVAGVVMVALQFLFLYIIFPSGMLARLSHATGGAIRATLIANLTISVAVIGGVLVTLGRQRFNDLALNKGWAEAAGLTLLVWLTLNGLETFAGWRAGALAVDPAWHLRPMAVVGQWIAVTFGTALQEEVLFRGVLLRQLYQRFRGQAGQSPLALFLALIVSQGMFAAMHLPILLSVGGGSLGPPLVGLFLAGCSLACLFLVSDNLALCIGIHGLADAPTLIVTDRWNLLDHQIFVNTVCWILIALYLSIRSAAQSSESSATVVRP